MAGERRGHFTLILGGLALLLLIGGGALYWHLHRERPTSIQIFHWVQGSTPLQILGAPPYTAAKGDNMAGMVDPKVRELFREMGISGELRLVGDLILSDTRWGQSGALLLKTMPQAPFTLTLVDEPAAVYVEHASGFTVIPAKSVATARTVTLTPRKNPQVDLLEFVFRGFDKPGAGAMGVWWW